MALQPCNHDETNDTGTATVSIQLHSTISIQLQELIKEESSTPDKLNGYEEWLRSFWLPVQQRKHPNTTLSLKDANLDISSTSSDITVDKSFWEKQLGMALKKIVVEDLGNFNALELYDSIPQKDVDGRGRTDLKRLETELGVKLVFSTSKHVLLVGPKPKLAKKCLVIRNILSHYHWRLSGKEVAM
jgi:hypothetical protein